MNIASWTTLATADISKTVIFLENINTNEKITQSVPSALRRIFTHPQSSRFLEFLISSNVLTSFNFLEIILVLQLAVGLMIATIVFRDMVWKLSKLQSGYNELGVYVEPYPTPCTSFVLDLLIFK